MRFAWIDLREVPRPQLQAVVDAAVHARMAGVVSADAELLGTLPPTVTRVLATGAPAPAAVKKANEKPEKSDKNEKGDKETKGTADAKPGTEAAGGSAIDVLLRKFTTQDELDALAADNRAATATPVAGFVDVRDDRTLQLSCAGAMALPYTVIHFADPTKIPLEIVLAAAESAEGKLVTVVGDLEEAAIVFDVLERGSDGILYAPRTADEVFALARLLQASTPQLELSTLTVESIRHVGLGDRVCVDTCSHFEEDEGILVGSYSSGFVLCCSETHPLPYMPTRPFRVNAGALHSYTLGPDNRTNYLSEVGSGSALLAVGADGRTRRVVVGRAKLESRPLLEIRTHAEDGRLVSLTVQDDWHVRVLGPGGKVLNVTELQAGDELLGYLATDKRHVGLPIGEFCKEV
ncbi:3-dehydroquinate synthase II family protein [Streptomyces ipomoeae]|uniref:3-dehydroquinate synthase n=2 Tax=Streptomyces ipomoeae TaxID=103232 RepID=L1L697_9ACTN|nr:3-dehydroquinate synthase II family protein [Streptomyces ipomoeae]EKX68289.1 3-dehydroquinate synthase [Streptomyces ipomoeae 91-03]MDX2698139.1 3-dehydroquinate synthase II family protein [Streptomyces ipomoeae]MDX2825332.1 3-dehydroquinate synthase II family protein [Streptomyces ipomoeae]MDX2843797.1 3-dehydroquinate synthase II family protein [Streptomyces ipomoeae]MDX2877964.1 3-dehydroquinate synthase II family protein [Streptomyces ipomoeae]